MAAAATSGPGRIGSKKIFLPNFAIALRRTPARSPKTAVFSVPLSFNKLDLRDYLWHAYGLKALNIRAFVIQSPLIERIADSRGKFYHRKRSEKRMVVEMERPFVWPAVPENLEAWDNAFYKDMLAEREKQQERAGPLANFAIREDRGRLAKLAKEVLEKRKAEQAAAAEQTVTEVETDFSVPR